MSSNAALAQSPPAAAGGQQQSQQQQSQQQQNQGSSAGLLLEGDGILTQLFYFLWRMKCQAVQAAGGGSTTTGTYNPMRPPKSDDPAIQAVMDLCIPSTVILEHNFPKFWYARPADFEDDDGSSAARSAIMNAAPPERRTGKDIDSASIIRAFRVPEGDSATQAPGPGDVVASYYAEATDDEGRACTRVEFLDQEGVKGLLIRRTRRPDGILQCWVSPSGKENSVVQVIWSPHVVHVTRRRNRFPLRDTRLPLYDRCVTFEGLAHYSDEVFVAPHVRLQANLVCEELVRGLRDVYRTMVSRMVLYFKSDTAGRLWFLFGSCIRVEKPERVPLRLSDRFAKPDRKRPERFVALSLRGMKPQDRVDAENNQSSRLARMLVDEAYEHKASREEHSKKEEYYRASKKLRLTAQEEPLIRSLVNTPLAPYAQYRPHPPSLGPIGDTYWPAPRRPGSATGGGTGAGGHHQNDGEGSGDDEHESGNNTNNNNNNNNNLYSSGADVMSGADQPMSPGSTQAGGTSSEAAQLQQQQREINAAARKAQNLTRLVNKIRTATMLSPPSQRTLASSLSCIVPPLFGATGTLRGGSLAMFGGATASRNSNNESHQPGNLQQQHSLASSPSVASAAGPGSAVYNELQQANYNGRTATTLWQIARLGVFSGAVKTVALRPELREFVKGVMYGLYSHFSAEAVLAHATNRTTRTTSGAGGQQQQQQQQQRPFRVVIPQTYFHALGDEWWMELGFAKTRIVRVAEVTLLVPPPEPPKPKQRKSVIPGEVAGKHEEVADGHNGDNNNHDDGDQQHVQAPRPTSPDGAISRPETPPGGDNLDGTQVLSTATTGADKPPILISAGDVVVGGAGSTPSAAAAAAASSTSLSPTDPHQAALRYYTQEQLDQRARRLVQVPLTAHPDDFVLEVSGLAAPLLHVQARLEDLMKHRIDLPAAKIRFFYAAHRVIMDRATQHRFAKVVRKAVLQHRVGM